MYYSRCCAEQFTPYRGVLSARPLSDAESDYHRPEKLQNRIKRVFTTGTILNRMLLHKRAAGAMSEAVSQPLDYTTRVARYAPQFLLFVATAFLLAHLLPVNDFVGYWSVGHQMLHRSNPYSPAQMLATEKAVGWPGSLPLLIWSPPWFLPVLLPLSVLPYHIAHFVWALASFMALAIGWKCLCDTYSLPTGHRLIWLFSFAPVVICLLIGQVTAFLLLGIACFLRCIRNGQDAKAGLAAALLAIKPQLLYLFWPALLIWVVAKRRWLVLVSLFGVLAVLTALVLFLNPKIFAAYLLQFREGPMFPSHAAGTVLRALFGHQRHWLQFLPCIAGLLWFVLRSRTRKTLDWRTELPLLAVVSLATSSYAWTYDQILLLPALAQAVSWSQAAGKRRQLMLLAAYLVISIGTAILAFTSVHAGALWWLLPCGYLLLYVIARPAPVTQAPVTNSQPA